MFYLKRVSLVLLLISVFNFFEKDIQSNNNAKVLAKYNTVRKVPQYILQIPKFNLEVHFNENTTLDVGLELHDVSKMQDMPIVISGHSGIGRNVYFNQIYLLAPSDVIILQKEKYRYFYEVEQNQEFKKGSKLAIKKSADYLYLVTCDLYDMQKQLIISSKLVKIEEI